MILLGLPLQPTIPTFIAQGWFSPAMTEVEQEEVLAREEESP
jgi:hypothetical protein